MEICRATAVDLQAVTALAMLLFPGHEAEALSEEMLGYIKGGGTAVFLARAAGEAVGIAQCGLRHDYVEGTSGGPVGYLEGVYVREGFRRSGIAAALVAACEDWARGQGCREFASDCTLDNTQSIAFHLGMGFIEANRLVCFVKELTP